MHTLSLVPVLLWVHEIISYPTDAFLYFLVPNDVKWNIVINRYLQAHSLNCILTKLTLIWSHRAMQNQFLRLFTPARCRSMMLISELNIILQHQKNNEWNNIGKFQRPCYTRALFRTEQRGRHTPPLQYY